MPDILSRRLRADDLDPELTAFALPIYRKYEAALLRVAANHRAPERFPLPRGENTTEAILANRFASLAKRQPDKADMASARALADFDNRPRLTRRLERAVHVDFGTIFGTDASVDELILPEAFLPQPDARSLERILDRHYSPLGMQRTQHGIDMARRVQFELLRIVCIDETDGLFGSEWGEDEIYLSLATIDESANVGKISPFKVGDFDDNTRYDFVPPRVMFNHVVGGGTSYPKHYFSTVFLLEGDEFSSVDATFTAVFRKFSDEVIAKVTAMIGGAIGTALGGAIGAALGALAGWLAGWLMGKLSSALLDIFDDDAFTPVTLELVIPDSTSRMNIDSQVFHFTGPGEYAVRYRWRVEEPQVQLLAPVN